MVTLSVVPGRSPANWFSLKSFHQSKTASFELSLSVPQGRANRDPVIAMQVHIVARVAYSAGSLERGRTARSQS